MNEQISLWECLYETKQIKKPIRLIECFAGIGSQFKALKRVFGDKVESYKIVEWAYNSIVAYNNIHLKDNTDYSKDLTKEELISKIRGISTNYNEPLSDIQLNRKPLTWLQKAYNNIKATHNLIDIMRVKGEDLEIVDKDKYEYILTYSFPCQDLSLAGLGKGMDVSQAEGGTRSGLLWEIKRILEELKEKDSLPQILLMENVPMLISKNHIHNFKKWDNFLTSLGYKNYTECLNAKDYGIPQNRDRCFMVSVLGDYNYTFPRKQELKLKLKDMLEANVDEKYYLTPKQIVDIQGWKAYEKPLEQLEKTDKKQVSPTITTRSGAYAAGMILVKNKSKKGYLIAKEGDGVDISGRMKYHSGTVKKDIIQTITTKGGNDIGVVVKDDVNLQQKLFKEILNRDLIKPFEIIDYSFVNARFKEVLNNDLKIRNVVNNNCCCTITTSVDNFGICVKDNVEKDLRIRKLTPKETTRLMGFEDCDYYAMKQDLSEMAIYHCCGDSIVVNVLENIFKQMKQEQ